MSASNWAICPQCVKRARENLVKSLRNLRENLSPEDFALVQRTMANVDPEDFRTFREDFEFSGNWELFGGVPENGAAPTITASYSGHCEECGFGTDFEKTVTVAWDQNE